MTFDAPARPDVELADPQQGQLNPKGHDHADPAWDVDLDDDTLREMYSWMVIARRVDREVINLHWQGQLGVYPSCLGQEAAQIGAAFALGAEDWGLPQYRELGLSLYLGVPQAASAQLWRGTSGLGYDPCGFRFAPISIPIGPQALHATGYAMGAGLDGCKLATVICFGDGATSTGDVHAAMTFAGSGGFRPSSSSRTTCTPSPCRFASSRPPPPSPITDTGGSTGQPFRVRYGRGRSQTWIT